MFAAVRPGKNIPSKIALEIHMTLGIIEDVNSFESV